MKAKLHCPQESNPPRAAPPYPPQLWETLEPRAYPWPRKRLGSALKTRWTLSPEGLKVVPDPRVCCGGQEPPNGAGQSASNLQAQVRTGSEGRRLARLETRTKEFSMHASLRAVFSPVGEKQLKSSRLGLASLFALLSWALGSPGALEFEHAMLSPEKRRAMPEEAEARRNLGGGP